MKNRKTSHLKDAMCYVIDSKKYIFLIIALFFISALVGFFDAKQFSFFDELLKNISANTKNLSGLSLMSYIFINNLWSSFAGLFGGIVFGITSVFNSVLNGAVIGYVFNKVYRVSGFSEFWRIIPHGIFELPAIFISLGLGLKLGASIFSNNFKKEISSRLLSSARVFVYIVIPLLIVAAIIESLLIMILR